MNSANENLKIKKSPLTLLPFLATFVGNYIVIQKTISLDISFFESIVLLIIISSLGGALCSLIEYINNIEYFQKGSNKKKYLKKQWLWLVLLIIVIIGINIFFKLLGMT